MSFLSFQKQSNPQNQPLLWFSLLMWGLLPVSPVMPCNLNLSKRPRYLHRVTSIQRATVLRYLTQIDFIGSRQDCSIPPVLPDGLRDIWFRKKLDKGRRIFAGSWKTDRFLKGCWNTDREQITTNHLSLFVDPFIKTVNSSIKKRSCWDQLPFNLSVEWALLFCTTTTCATN